MNTTDSTEVPPEVVAWVRSRTPEAIADALIALDGRCACAISVAILGRIPPELSRSIGRARSQMETNPAATLGRALFGALGALGRD